MKDNEVIAVMIGAVVGCIISAVIYITAVSVQHMEPTPACTEDATIVGQGEYTNGRWEYYVCGPAYDDLSNP